MNNRYIGDMTGSPTVAENRKLTLTATGTGLNTENTGLNHWIALKLALKNCTLRNRFFCYKECFIDQKTMNHLLKPYLQHTVIRFFAESCYFFA